MYKFTTTDFPHDILTPTYTFNPTSFLIDYADGAVNEPNQQDIFTGYFTLPTTNSAKAQSVVDELNALINGTKQIEDAQYSSLSSIKGLVQGPPPEDFNNSPEVYTPKIDAIPEPRAIGLISMIGAGLLAAKRIFSV